MYLLTQMALLTAWQMYSLTLDVPTDDVDNLTDSQVDGPTDVDDPTDSQVAGPYDVDGLTGQAGRCTYRCFY